MNRSILRTLAMLVALIAVAVVWSGGLVSNAEDSATRKNARPRGLQAKLNSTLPLLGHRNWIVIADSAYPQQSAAGIETRYTRAGQLEVLETVLQAVEAAPHVQAIVLLDEELESVPEEHAPGVAAYRRELKQQLKGKKVQVMPHEEIISQLDEASKLFNILILKTDMVIPYTSVFLQLDCGYWDAEKEQALRDAIGSAQK